MPEYSFLWWVNFRGVRGKKFADFSLRGKSVNYCSARKQLHQSCASLWGG